MSGAGYLTARRTSFRSEPQDIVPVSRVVSPQDIVPLAEMLGPQDIVPVGVVPCYSSEGESGVRGRVAHGGGPSTPVG